MKRKKGIVQAESPDGQRAGELIVEAVENQLLENDPPETNQTLNRLVAAGESRQDAIRYIACVLSVEVFEVTKNNEMFNRKRFIKNLLALPKLPFDEENEI